MGKRLGCGAFRGNSAPLRWVVTLRVARLRASYGPSAMPMSAVGGDGSGVAAETAASAPVPDRGHPIAGAPTVPSGDVGARARERARGLRRGGR